MGQVLFFHFLKFFFRRILLLCFTFFFNLRIASSAGFRHDTSTTWYQRSNLIQSNRTAVAENKTQYCNKEMVQQTFKCIAMHNVATVARQGLPCYMVVARLGFKRRATAMLKSNLIRSIEFSMAVGTTFEMGLSAIYTAKKNRSGPHKPRYSKPDLFSSFQSESNPRSYL